MPSVCCTWLCDHSHDLFTRNELPPTSSRDHSSIVHSFLHYNRVNISVRLSFCDLGTYPEFFHPFISETPTLSKENRFSTSFFAIPWLMEKRAKGREKNYTEFDRAGKRRILFIFSVSGARVGHMSLLKSPLAPSHLHYFKEANLGQKVRDF